MSTLWQDVRYGLRMIAHNPGFTLVAVLALAIGIGANATIFSFINGVALRPIAGVSAPAQLVAVYTSDYSSGLYGGSSYPDYVDFRDQSDAFAGLAAYEETVLNLSGPDAAERVRGAYVTGNYFDVLGVGARVGRTLHATDDVTPGAHPVVVISHGLWQRRFGADPAIVGRTVTLDERTFTVLGVAAENFRGLRIGQPPEFWLPMMMMEGAAEMLHNRGSRGIEITGRLRPDVPLAQAQAQISAIGARLASSYPESNMGTLARPQEPRPMTVVHEARVEPQAQKNIGAVLGLLLAVVGLVLLIACANVANLLLARASVRQREIAIRLALGAGRWRLIRQLLTESLLLALIGGTLGLLASLWAVDLIPTFFPPGETGGLDLSLDWRVLAFTCVVALLTGLIFGLAPALQATRLDLTTALKDDASLQGHGLRRLSLRSALVVAQLALSLVLLIGAGLFLRSLRHALTVGPGFVPQNLLLASIKPGGTVVQKNQWPAFYQQAVERIGSLPGVRSVSLTRVVPISGGGQRRGVTLDGYQPQANEDTELNTNVVGANYFATMAIPLVGGRDFGAEDKANAPGVVIVNEELARRYFPNQNAVGKRLRFGGPANPYLEIVGVARDARYRSLREQPLPFIYIPLAQEAQESITLLVRTAGEPLGVVPAVRTELRGLNKDVPVYNVQTMSEHIDAALAADRMVTALLSAFGATALLLAAIGIYGVMAYSVAQRTREIGVRMALGAQGSDIARLIVGQGLVLILIGVACGLALAFALTRAVGSLLFDVSATDPLTFAAITLLLATVALVACYIPARRATKVDPMVALRYE